MQKIPEWIMTKSCIVVHAEKVQTFAMQMHTFLWDLFFSRNTAIRNCKQQALDPATLMKK